MLSTGQDQECGSPNIAPTAPCRHLLHPHPHRRNGGCGAGSVAVVVVALGCTAFWRHAAEEACFEQVRSDFAVGDFAKARERLGRRSSGLSHRDRAQAGLVLADALEQEAPLSAAQKAALAELPFDLSPLVAESLPARPLFLGAAPRGADPEERRRPERALCPGLPGRAGPRPRGRAQGAYAGLPGELPLRRKLDGYLAQPAGQRRPAAGPRRRPARPPRKGPARARRRRAARNRAAPGDRAAGRPSRGRRLLASPSTARSAKPRCAALDRFHGSIVVVDPKSGEILAAVSDPLTFATGGSPALEQMREPASIAKILTTAAALRAGVDPDHFLSDRVCRGQEYYDGEVLYCPSVAGRLRGLDKAMAVSCNVAFASLGVCSIGRQAVLGEYKRVRLRPAARPLQERPRAAAGRQRPPAGRPLDRPRSHRDHPAARRHAGRGGGQRRQNGRAAPGAPARRPPRPAPARNARGRRRPPGALPALAADDPPRHGSGGRTRHRQSGDDARLPGRHENRHRLPTPPATSTSTTSATAPWATTAWPSAVRITDQRSSRWVRSVASVVTGHLLEGLYQIGQRRGWRLESPAAARHLGAARPGFRPAEERPRSRRRSRRRARPGPVGARAPFGDARAR